MLDLGRLYNLIGGLGYLPLFSQTTLFSPFPVFLLQKRMVIVTYMSELQLQLSQKA